MSGLTRSLFTLLPISTLTLLQFSSGKAIRFVVFFSALPTIFGLIYQIGAQDESARSFMSGLMLSIILGTLLPIATLILATSALRDEIDDRTMVYLVVKPVMRLRIIAEKYLAVTEITIMALWLGLIATWLIISFNDLADSVDTLVAALVTLLVGVLVYGAVFIAVSLLVPRALLVGIIYSLMWETFLSRIIPGTWVLSIRHYVQSIYIRLIDDSSVSMDNAVQLYSALPALAVTVVIALLLATWRLRAMDFE
jgi:ABC-2 type transport system permease protein